ncbi:multicopper oxidase domain-containing protein [Granulicella sp. dw_53]|uniref:multicopper oxidase family protein n=1 Tax=Granulicella sp. dw_53 TaxID=2719792 RepID=UPI001BD69317|nr:multicopper oxidase domain-containing protein [Granulicella sp. dw_53]
MQRRHFIQLGSLALAQTAAARLAASQMPGMAAAQPQAPPATKADITLRIEPVTVELSPDRILSTIGYNGTSPGPILRMKEGKPISVDVINDTDTPELVHWHGLLIPSDVDGVEEEGTPFVPPRGRRRYSFTPKPFGSRWYHSHAMAFADLHKGAYTGQFGFIYIDPAADPGRYDQEHFLALRDWEPFFTSSMVDDDDDTRHGPQPEKPAVLNTDPNGLEVGSMTYSINDKSLGAGEPLRVKAGQRVLLHLLNASAIENRRIALTGHKFLILALDGNPVPTPQAVEAILLGAGERVDAIVEMNNPGIWIMGATNEKVRSFGLGLIVEYENQHTQPKWVDPSKDPWDYTIFGAQGATPPSRTPDHTFDMAFEKIPAGANKFNTFLVNGKPYPRENEFVLKQGARYRLIMRNRTDDAHPLHLHRHQLELVDMNGVKTSGIIKDTVVVPFFGRATVDFTADQPGLSLFHCHIQQHMDYGFKALFRYA